MKKKWLRFSVPVLVWIGIMTLLICGCAKKDYVTFDKFNRQQASVRELFDATVKADEELTSQIRGVAKAQTALEEKVRVLEEAGTELQTNVKAINQCKCNGKCCNAPDPEVCPHMPDSLCTQLSETVTKINERLDKLANERRGDQLLITAEFAKLTKRLDELVHWANDTEAFLNKRHPLKQQNCPTGQCPYAKEK